MCIVLLPFFACQGGAMLYSLRACVAGNASEVVQRGFFFGSVGEVYRGWD